MELEPGDLVGERFRLDEKLGNWEVGHTWRARDEASGELVAMKALDLSRVGDWKAVELFEREAAVLGSLEHPAIPAYVACFEVETGAGAGGRFLAQTLAHGQSLRALLEQGWHPGEAEVREIAEQLLEVLVYLQALNPPVVHRDLKPENLIRKVDGSLSVVDFGAVRGRLGGDGAASTVAGTFGYMAPEQFQGQAGLGTDLYGLGATLVALSSRREPSELPHEGLRCEFRGSVEVNRDLGDWLERCLEPAPEDRFANAAEALAALRGEVGARSVPTRLTKPEGSRVELVKRGPRLELRLPPIGFTRVGAGLRRAVVAFAPLLIGLVAAAAAPERDLGTIAVVNMVLGAAGLGFWIDGALASRWLALDRDGLTFERRGMFRRRAFRAALEDIDGVKRDPVGAREGLTLVVGVDEHRLGSALTTPERAWIAEELAAHLAWLRSR